MNNILCGVDLGGTKLAIGLVKENGVVIDKIVVYDHTTKNDREIVQEICDIIKKLLQSNALKEESLLGIGVVFPGHIRSRQGITITSSNIKGLKNFPLKSEIEKYIRSKVITDNDANAQAYAEYRFGAGVGYDNMIFVTISSGIGAGIIIERKIYRGITGTAGEFGHMIVDPHGELKCGCGNYGCLMTFTCGQALGKIFKKYLLNGMETKLQLDENVSASDINGRILKKGLEMNDFLTMKVVDQCAQYLGIGLYNLFQMFNPPLFVLGGGLMNLGNYFFDQIKFHFYNYARDMLYDDVHFTLSKLKEDAGIIGAASLVLESQ
jgi:glucokinase